ncbi:unnamed protein product [Urochloa humidicola]
MPHGKLGIADGAISIAEKEEIKTRKRCAQPLASAREKRLERENMELRKENDGYRELMRVVRAMAAKGGMDYDALARETAPDLDPECEDTFSWDNDKVANQDLSEQDNTNGRDYTNDEDEEYDYNKEGYNDYEDDENYDKHGSELEYDGW